MCIKRNINEFLYVYHHVISQPPHYLLLLNNHMWLVLLHSFTDEEKEAQRGG